MAGSKQKMDHQEYYTAEEYDKVLLELPILIQKVKARSAECMEPTWSERMSVMKVVRDFIKEKKRIVYGGMAVHELVKHANPNDGIYGKYQFADIEFYSFEPVIDIVELCNRLYRANFKDITGKAAQHEETFSIFVNQVGYCDISYVPRKINAAIRTIDIGGIKYAHPHFMLIDHFRIFNQPLTAAEQRWEKTFKRMFKLQKYYPLPYLPIKINIPKPSQTVINYVTKIKTDFFSKTDHELLISGYDAYNLMIRYILGYPDIERSKDKKMKAQLEKYICNSPFLELVSTNYQKDVKSLYDFLRSNVENRSELKLVEYWPLFQFTGFSVDIVYEGEVLVRVTRGDGFCVPNIKTDKSYQYVGYQYVLMSMMIKKFQGHVEREESVYKNAGIAVSNLVAARDVFLKVTKLGVINNTPITDFKVGCVGKTVDFRREAHRRQREAWVTKGKRQFKYEPETFLPKSEEERARFNPAGISFKNSAGTKITSKHYLWFPTDGAGEILSQEPVEIDDETPDEASE